MSNKLLKLFGLPETAEKPGLFRLRFCEIFSLGVFCTVAHKGHAAIKKLLQIKNSCCK